MVTFTATGNDLHDACSWASRVVPARPTQPLLGGLLLDACDDQLAIGAFDFDTAVQVTISALVTTPGRVLLSARLLAGIAKAVARDVDVTITVDGPTATVRCGRSEWTLPTLPVEDYPALPGLSGPIGEVDAEVLRHALGRVLPVVGTDPSLAMLTGVKLDGDADGLTLIGTDRFRAGRARIPWKPVDGAAVDALVPAELLETASRAARGTVRLSCGDSTFGVTTDTHTVTGRLIAARYPNVDRVIPAPGGHWALVDTADLSRAVDEAMVMLDREPAIKLAVTAEQVEVSVTGEDRGARASARVHALHGDPGAVALNADYLRTALRTMGSDAVAVHINGERKPVLLLPATTDGDVIDGYEHIVMAVRST